MSVNRGDTVNFKIKTPAASYHIDILRLGYYQGNGARKIVAGLRPAAALPQSQPSCLVGSSTGLIDCGNWAVSASWTVPATAVSGLYIALLVRDDTGGTSQIPFVVRDDSSHSDLVFQTSDTAWEAYNTYGGNSLYTCTVSCPAGNPLAYKAAFKVSYNRPFTFTDDGGVASPYYAEFPMIRFLERNGFDVSYISGADTDSRGALLLNHKAFLSVGHDEYWSGGQRASVEAARAAGVSLAFFSGNEVFWKTRWEPSIDGSNSAYRTLVSYKETHFDAPTDPNDPSTWTGTWRDPRFSPPADGGRPENALTGQFFIVNSGTTDIQVPSAYAKLRFWRNTAVANLTPGQTLTLAPGTGTLGYEWDEVADNGFSPAGLFELSSTTSSSAETFTDYGSTTAKNQTATHHLTLYRAPSGALVFGAGTVQWSWGLDSSNGSGKPPDPNMEQATVNLLADMGAQPNTLVPGLVAATASTDATPPTSTISSPAAGANLQDGTNLTITGTATDTGGGVVAGVEVSTDGGTTWHPAPLTSAAGQTVTWSYPWVIHGAPSATIESRATDDSGNIEAPPRGTAVNVNCPCSIWGTSSITPTDSGDGASVEVGVKFKTDTFGTVNGIRFYKVSANTGTHVGSLWTSTGQLLAQATFSGESAAGWQQVSFSSPVPINPNTTYVASYHSPVGHYAQTTGYFYPSSAPQPDGGSIVDSPPLHALRTTEPSTNGIYTYNTNPSFPANSYHAQNYWVDVAFSPSPPPGQVTAVSATAGNASAQVTWTAPSSGGAVTSYTVTPYIGVTAQPATTVTGSPAATSASVSGLINGMSYTFVVTAVNPNGSGPASAASNVVSPLATASNVFNGGFENGLYAWTAGGVVTPAATTARAHSGSDSVLLGMISGTEPNGDSWVTQTVAVPAGTSNLTFFYWPATSDNLCSGATCAYDWEEAQIRSTSGTTLATVFKSNSDAQAWTQVSFDMSAYAGQTVALWFNVHQDGGGDPSGMYLDDVAINGTGATAPGAPSNVVASAGNAQATVSWTAPANGGSPITSYTITPYIGSAAQTPTTITGSPPLTAATITGLTNGASYTFTVVARNAIGTGQASSPSSAVTPAAPTLPGPPGNVSANPGNGQATVSWTAPANGGSPITSYTIIPYVGAAPQPSTTITGSPPSTSATITGLTNATSYTFTVAATNSVGAGLASNASNAVTPAGAPGAPTTVVATAANAQASVSWSAPSDGGSPITSYTITPYLGTTALTPTTVTGSPPAVSATVSGLANGTTYTFTVTAVSAIGAGPASTASNAVTPLAPPGAPTNVTALAGDTQATVSWTAPSNGGSVISSYTITPYIGSTAQPQTTITGSPPTTSTTITGLTDGTAYTFTVAATNGAGPGPASSASNAVTPTAPTAPGAPTGVSATGGNASATVGWTAPSNGGSPISSYTVTPYIGTIAQTATTVVGSPPATSTTISGLTNGTTYTFTVAAANLLGSGAASSPSNAVTPSATVASVFVQQVSAHGHATSLSVTPAANVSAGNRLVVLVGVWSNPAATAKSVTDAAGNTYTEVLHFTASDHTEESVWTAPVTSGGGTKPKITVTPTAIADVGVAALEYAGLSTASGVAAVDQTAQKSGTTSGAATVSSGPTAATSASGELAIGFYADSGFGDTLTAGSGFTSRVNVSKASDMELLAQDQLPAQGGTPNAGVGTGANTVWLMSTVVFKHG